MKRSRILPWALPLQVMHLLRRWLVLLPFLPVVLLALSPPARAEDFLEPGQAFRLGVASHQGAALRLHFDIAPGYYLYRERLELRSRPEGVTLAQARLPDGQVKHDETFQKDLEVYHERLDIDLDLQALVAGADGPRELVLTSQGCAEKGLCYPPRAQRIALQVAGGAIASARVLGDEAPQDAGGAAAAPASPLPGGDRFASVLGSGSLLKVAAAFALAGVLLSFTPCVLPMVPILSSIIVGQGAPVSRARGLGLSLAYALGMALVYTGFGVAAGLAGEGLAAALQTPWVLAGFALLLAGLSLSMFGLYELQLPASLQSRLSTAGSGLQGGRHGAVFLMGGLSALIVGPCVAAPLAGALLYISQTRDVVLGGTALFSMALGMSVPLVLVGLSAGSLLPRAGRWMETVKRVFGVLLLGVAVWMVTPLLPVALLMAAWGALALAAAVVLWRAAPAGGAGRALLRGLALLGAALALAQWGGALSGGRDVLRPLAHLGRATVAVGEPLAWRRVRTLAELEAAVREAGRPVMFDFYADWCVSCKEMERYTFSDPRVRERLAGVLLLQVDVTANSADDRALLRRFQLFGPPAILFFDASGRELADRRVIGFQPADDFLASLAAAGIR